ncbi:MAG TPA: hypothetical protein VJQ45_00125 [Ktedonobacterales bacterium]|nr:hypothetical protein [Ktedonobacterales bacterium]
MDSEPNDVVIPPSPAAAVNVGTNTDIAALIAAAVDKAVQAQVSAAVQAASGQPGAPVEPTPEERVAAAIENAGAGLGVEERLREVYAVLAHLAAKVGL